MHLSKPDVKTEAMIKTEVSKNISYPQTCTKLFKIKLRNFRTRGKKARKNLELLENLFFFLIVTWLPSGQVELLSRGQPHWFGVNQLEPCNEFGSLSCYEPPVEFEPLTIRF